MPLPPADAVICGAGIAGITAAFHLVRRGMTNLVLVDDREPLTLTSDKGTQAYRNFWPGPDDTPDDAMLRFMDRSIDLLEDRAAECDNAFQLNRRGYVFLTANPAEAARLRIDPDPAAIRRLFPFISETAIAMLRVPRAGWLDAVRLGRWLLDRTLAAGARLVRDRVTGVSIVGGRVQAVRLRSGGEIPTGAFVLAAGPYLKEAAALLGLDLRVFCELHGKLTFRDDLRVIPQDVPLMIWNDPVGNLPPGLHFRPRGDPANPLLLIIWTYDVRTQEPVWPPSFDPSYGEVLVRGMAAMVPGFARYQDRAAEGLVDGGYYCKTRENRPLIGPLPVAGAFVIGALSGFGVMASQAAGELLALHVAGDTLPGYAPAFLPSRYQDSAYLKRLPALEQASGQL